jgi:trk system potassium uptake protein TrkA
VRIIVVGAGEVGYHIAGRLVQENHDVVVIEEDPRVRERVQSELDVMVIQANGASPAALEEAGIEKTDMLIAVTDVDEVNLTACLLAREWGVRTKIARARNPELSASPFLQGGKRLGIDLLINPNQAVAEEIAKLVRIPAAAQAALFAEGRIQFLGVRVGAGAPILHTRLADLAAVQGRYPFLIVALSRRGRLLIPDGQATVEPEDKVYVVTRKESVPEILRLLGHEESETRSAFLIGGGRIGLAVAQILEAEGVAVKVLEQDPARCQFLADKLQRSLVLQGDGTDIRILQEEGIAQMDAVVTVSNDEATNILAALLGKRYGAAKAIALVQRPDFIPLAASLGIDAALSPRLVTAGVILKYVRRGKVVSLVELSDWEAESMELIIPAGAPVVGRRLRDANLPADALVGAICRGEEVLIPKGDTVLAAGDRVILFTLPGSIAKVERLFAG